jgi:hypothetical protein
MNRDREGQTASWRGVIAFWSGRPVCVNPEVGNEAREWTRGWRQAEAALLQHVPDARRDASGRYDRALVDRYRPDDVPAYVPTAPRRRGGVRGVVLRGMQTGAWPTGTDKIAARLSRQRAKRQLMEPL